MSTSWQNESFTLHSEILLSSFICFQVTVSSTAELCCKVMQIVKVHLDTTSSFSPHDTRQTMIFSDKLRWAQLGATKIAGDCNTCLQGETGEWGLFSLGRRWPWMMDQSVGATKRSSRQQRQPLQQCIEAGQETTGINWNWGLSDWIEGETSSQWTVKQDNNWLREIVQCPFWRKLSGFQDQSG